MNRIVLTILTTIFAASQLGTGQAPVRNEWVGIWHAELGGQPTGNLTLATDTGELGGTIVLDVVSGDGGTPHVIASEPHVLMDPSLEGKTLSFEVKAGRRDGSVVLAHFVVTLIEADRATIHCTNCGADAPLVQLVRGQ
jgi:hypothetical protein